MWHKKLANAFRTPTLSRQFILKRPVLKLVGPLKGKHILEMGCGSGYWLRIFRSAGVNCTGIDISTEQIKLATAQGGEGIEYSVHDAATFRPHKNFDIIFIDHVLSETRSSEKILKILRNGRRLLKKDGFIVLNEMHPSIVHFLTQSRPGRSYFYFKSGHPLKFHIKQANGAFITLSDYHWTLDDFAGFLKKAGFLIKDIIEPRAPKTRSLDSYLQRRYQAPTHILIKAVPH